MDTITFRQHTPDARGLVQVDISTAVEGNYEGLINFLDKLEHSENFYVLAWFGTRLEQLGPSTIESSIEELLPNLICRAGISS